MEEDIQILHQFNSVDADDDDIAIVDEIQASQGNGAERDEADTDEEEVADMERDRRANRDRVVYQRRGNVKRLPAISNALPNIPSANTEEDPETVDLVTQESQDSFLESLLHIRRPRERTPPPSPNRVFQPPQLNPQPVQPQLNNQDEDEVNPLPPLDEELDFDYPLKDFKDKFDGVFSGPISDDNWTEFEALMEETVKEVRKRAKIKDPEPKANRVRKKPKPNDAKFIQRLYRDNRRKAVRLITDPDPVYCKIPKAEVEEHYKRLCEYQPADCNFYQAGPRTRPKLDIRRLQSEEVERLLRKAENTSPGEDRITYRDWLKMDPKAYVLTTIFSICLRHRRVPKSWKTSSTILTYKNKGEKEDIGSWRPIALSSTISKLYSKVLAGRLTKWLEANNVLSHCQKGFMPYDGVLEHNYVLEERINRAKKNGEELCVAWLDFANAFPSVSHDALLEGLDKAGVGPQMVAIIKDLYTGATTQIRTDEGFTAEIEVKRGIKQGDPISGLLFNIAIDAIIRKVQGHKIEHEILAFADDLTPMDRTADGLQRKLDTINELSSMIGMPLKPSKCHTLHIQRKMWIPTQFYTGYNELNILDVDGYVDYLGKPVGFRVIPSSAKLEEFKDKGLSVLTSSLAPWQKLDAMKTFVYPAMTHAMRMGTYTKVEWEGLDEDLKKEVRTVLNLPDNSSLDYMYGSRTSGAIGLPNAAEEGEIFRIDSAFKLLSSKDPTIRDISKRELGETVRTVTRMPATTSGPACGSMGTRTSWPLMPILGGQHGPMHEERRRDWETRSSGT